MSLEDKYRVLVDGLYNGVEGIGRKIGRHLMQDGEDGRETFAQLLFNAMSCKPLPSTVTVGTLRDIYGYGRMPVPGANKAQRVAYMLKSMFYSFLNK